MMDLVFDDAPWLTGGTTTKTLKTSFHRKESAIREGRYFITTEARKHTLAKLIDKYLEEVFPKKPKARSQKYQLEYWRDILGHHVLADVTPKVIAKCRDELLKGITPAGNVRSPATVKRYLAALSHVFTVAIKDWEMVKENPVSNVTKPTEPRGRIRYLSEDETINTKMVEGEKTRLLKACEKSENTYLYIVVVLAISTGMRQGEIMNLKWKDVDLNKGQIILYDTKNDEPRAVPLVGKAMELVKKHPRRLDTQLLFPSKVNKEKPMLLRKPWEIALRQAEITDFHFHDLRHTAASYLAMNGASLNEIAEILGHKTLEMVKRYAHLSEAHTASVVLAMNDRVFGGR